MQQTRFTLRRGRVSVFVRATVAALCMAAGALALPQTGAAEYPEKPVTLVVWSSAGGALDTYGRKLAELLEKEAGWTVKVDNRPGGSGAVGLSQIVTQPADGSNILVLTGTLTFGIAQGLIPFKLEDLRLLRAMRSSRRRWRCWSTARSSRWTISWRI